MPTLGWKKGVPTIGANGIAANVPGEVDQYLDWAVPSYAKLYKYTKDEHYLDVARVLLHGTKAMLAMPGRTYDLQGPGWQQEHWRMGAGEREASAPTAPGCRGFPSTTCTASPAWKSSIRTCINDWQRELKFSFCVQESKICEGSTMNMFRNIVMLVFGVLVVLAFQVFSAAQGSAAPAAAPSNAPRSIAPYFTPATSLPKAPDADGFLQRWLLLEPINKPNRSNTVFTDSYIRNAFNTEYFPNQFTVVPHDGDKVTVAGQELAWHALDSANFNVKLFRFAYGLNKPTYGVLFWAVTVVNSPREMKNVRMAVGSNSASMWWLNGKEAVILSGDRRMVMDDCVSKRLTLNKGRNVIRGAVINGPGMSDFCVRFIDENGEPIKDHHPEP